MPLLPSRSAGKPPSHPTLSETLVATPYDDASFKQAQSYWTSNITTPPSLSEQQIRGKLSGQMGRNPDAERTRQRWIQVKNRRRRWIELHPEYFQGSELESADPLLYDRLVRRFQSAPEREAEGKNRGFAATMEASIQRGEARIEEARTRQDQGLEARHPMDTSLGDLNCDNRGLDQQNLESDDGIAEHFDDREDKANDDETNAEDFEGPRTLLAPDSKDDALRQWHEAMSVRFLEGKDNEFDYKAVDDNSEWDDHEEEERRRMEDWFDDEEPSWGTPGSGDEQVEKILTGETGVQDY